MHLNHNNYTLLLYVQDYCVCKILSENIMHFRINNIQRNMIIKWMWSPSETIKGCELKVKYILRTYVIWPWNYCLDIFCSNRQQPVQIDAALMKSMWTWLNCCSDYSRWWDISSDLEAKTRVLRSTKLTRFKVWFMFFLLWEFKFFFNPDF